MKVFKLVMILGAVFLFLVSSAMAGETLDAVKARGEIVTGVNGSLFGFGMPDEKGVWKGLDVDTARAISAAIFGDADKVKYVPLTAVQRFTALQSGEIDVLTRNATRTLNRETALGLNFVQCELLRRPGLPDSEEIGSQERQGIGRRHHLRIAGYDHGDERGRLFPDQ